LGISFSTVISLPHPPFLFILSILQMVNTRNRNVNAKNNDAENNNAANPPPTLEQVLMMQAQMLQTMQQSVVNMQNAQLQAPPQPPRDRLGDFQCTKPPTFSHSVELMDADKWLKTVEKETSTGPMQQYREGAASFAPTCRPCS
jgi:hypothetical protein